jgi:hypothetical protein
MMNWCPVYRNRKVLLSVDVDNFAHFFSRGSASRTEFESDTLILGENKSAKLFALKIMAKFCRQTSCQILYFKT